MLSGDGGIGKSLLTLQLLTAAATGTRWLGLDTMRCRAMGVYCEDDSDEIWRRMEDITRGAETNFSELEDLTFASRVGQDNLLMRAEDKFGRSLKATPLYDEIRIRARETGVQLLVLDSLHDLFGGNENSRPEARFFVNLLRRIALEIDGAVVLCAHPSMSGLQSGDGTSGSTAWNNAVRSRLYLSRPKADKDDHTDPDARVLTSKKANYGKVGFQLPLKWVDGLFVSDQPDHVMQRLERGAIERAIIERVKAAWDKDAPLSSTPSVVDRYLPTVIARKERKWRLVEIQRAMQGLIDSGAILPGQQRTTRSPKGLMVAPKPGDAPGA
jgi:RecA-family ATPase